MLAGVGIFTFFVEEEIYSRMLLSWRGISEVEE
jgi:hypothetical protein